MVMGWRSFFFLPISSSRFIHPFNAALITAGLTSGTAFPLVSWTCQLLNRHLFPLGYIRYTVPTLPFLLPSTYSPLSWLAGSSSCEATQPSGPLLLLLVAVPASTQSAFYSVASVSRLSDTPPRLTSTNYCCWIAPARTLPLLTDVRISHTFARCTFPHPPSHHTSYYLFRSLAAAFLHLSRFGPLGSAQFPPPFSHHSRPVTAYLVWEGGHCLDY